MLIASLFIIGQNQKKKKSVCFMMNKQTVVQAYHRKIVSHNEERTIDTQNSLDGFQGIKWK